MFTFPREGLPGFPGLLAEGLILQDACRGTGNFVRRFCSFFERL